MNPASEYVEASRERSPMHRYVADHGQGVSAQAIKHVTIAGHHVALSADVTVDERTLIKQAVQATTPFEKACFANALKMWEYDHRFEYTEGFAVMTDLDLGGVEHAWCMLDGEKLVDVTETFDYYYGTTISDPDVLKRYTRSELTASGIIGNHNDRYQFLQERGYVDNR